MHRAVSGFAVLLLLSSAAVAADKPARHPDDPAPADTAPKPFHIGPGPGHAMPPPPATGRPGLPNASGNAGGPTTLGNNGLPINMPKTGARPGGRDGHDRDEHRRHRDDQIWGGPFYPYPPMPMTWPYPPYPYSQYYYPYPPQYHPNNIYGDDDYPPTSTRGLVVPGDLPVGITAYWNYCDAPDGFYPYVKDCSHEWTRIPISPPPPGTATPLSYSDWQWCEEKKAFFPYVTSCPAGFEPIPVTAPGKAQAGPPQTANWYFCDTPRGYSPYVVQCARDWRAVPAVPPPSVKITVKDETKKK
jgi:hypothetical protein